MHSRFGGFSFYEYHKAFSAKAAQYLTIYNIKVDWSIRDNDLFCSVFAGHKAQACSICNSLTHATMFCGQVEKSTPNPNFQSKPMHNGVEICLKWNQGTCVRKPCPYVHRCTHCKSNNHAAHQQLCRKTHQVTKSATSASPATGQHIPTITTPLPDMSDAMLN